MSVEGPSVDVPTFQTPMDVLLRLYEKHKEQKIADKSQITLVERNNQRPKRLFSDVLKGLDKPTHDSDFFKGAGFKSFEVLLLNHDLPVTQDLVTDTRAC